MINTLRSKILATLFGAVFLATSWVDASGLDACPHHDWLPEAGSGEMVGVHDAGHHGSQPTGHSSHESACTCVGVCGVTGVGSIALPSLSDWSVEVVHRWNRVATPERSVVVAWTDSYLLPFPNGPPSLI